LFLVALLLFVGAYLLKSGYLTFSVGRIPVWYLFAFTGIAAALGGAVAFLFTGDEVSPDASDRDVATAPSAVELVSDESELGRPRPAVRTDSVADEPWRETWPEDHLALIGSPALLTASSVKGNQNLHRTELEAVASRLDSIELETASRARRTSYVDETNRPRTGDADRPSVTSRGEAAESDSKSASLPSGVPPQRPRVNQEIDSVFAELKNVEAELAATSRPGKKPQP
jgi:hypothetical protein